MPRACWYGFLFTLGFFAGSGWYKRIFLDFCIGTVLAVIVWVWRRRNKP